MAGKITGGGPQDGNLSWYHDPLPTNCVADWVCPAGSEAGFPAFSYTPGPEYGYNNLAVFYQACTFDCLFCQNWHFRPLALKKGEVSSSCLAAQLDSRTACICYFGGDPTPQLSHALVAARLARQHSQERVLRICWETNGAMNQKMLREMARLSTESGGCIKFDLKAFSQELHLALCGVSNRRTLENFRFLATLVEERPDPPLLVASTLLVPGYVDEGEVGAIARFIASLNVNIPYALLAFYPHFCMSDLPTTSKSHALACQRAALAAGLKNVRLGNLHLLRNDY